MSRTTARNLLICITQLLVTESLLVVPDIIFRHTVTSESILAPISLLALAPIWAVEDRAFGGFLAILLIDIAFLSIMTFSITRNHKVIGGVCLFLFNFMGIGFIAAGY
jgi:hypothetical protein